MAFPQKSWWLGWGLIVGFWLWVGLHDYPAPFFDDSAYVGAAINLAQGGTFSNPRCESLATIGSGEHFFINMPLHSYVLAGWLRLVGISSFSFHLFYTGLAMLASLLIYRFFPVRNVSWVCGFLVSIAVYGLLGGAGLRADALGLVFFLLGADLFYCRNVFSFFSRSLFLGLTVITFPTLALLAILVSLSALVYQKMILGRSVAELKNWVLAAAVAYLLAFLLFSICIGGLFGEFAHGLAGSQHVGADGVRSRFHFWTPMGIAKWAVVQASFLALIGVLFVRWKGDPRWRSHLYFLSVIGLSFFILGFASLNSASGAHLWAFGCLVVSLFIIVDQSWGWRAWSVWFLLLGVAAFGHAHGAIEGLLSDPPPGPQKRAEILADIARRHPRRLNVDVYAMKELYDYRLPDNAYYFEWCSTTGWAAPYGAETLPPDSLSVVSVKNAYLTHLTTGEGSDARFMQIFGHTMVGAFQNVFDLELIDNRATRSATPPGPEEHQPPLLQH